jgi:hypothetical protein
MHLIKQPETLYEEAVTDMFEETEMEPFANYNEISFNVREYVCTVAGVNRIEDISLTEINTFLSGLEEWMKEIKDKENDRN